MGTNGQFFVEAAFQNSDPEEANEKSMPIKVFFPQKKDRPF